MRPLGLWCGLQGCDAASGYDYCCRCRDVMCGLLHCDHAAEKLAFWKEALTLTLPETWVHTEDGRRHHCNSVILDVGLDVADPGMALDGTRCGHQRVGYS